MKLFNAIAAAAVIGFSLFAVTPAEAFWGSKKLNYEYLMNSQASQKHMQDLYRSENWIFYRHKEATGEKFYLIKIGCKGSKCIYASKIGGATLEEISFTEIDCIGRKFRFAGLGKFSEKEWDTDSMWWTPGWGIERAAKLICN